MRAALVAATVYAVSTFARSRHEIFSCARANAVQVHSSEAWLRAQCANATFRDNIGQYHASMGMQSDMCALVLGRRSPVMQALQAAASAPWLQDLSWPVWGCLLLLPAAGRGVAWLCSRLSHRNRRRMFRERDVFR
jgi:hypothetical protein